MQYILCFLAFVASPFLFALITWVVSRFDQDKKWVDMDKSYNPPWE